MEENRLNVLLTLVDKKPTKEEVLDVINSHVLMKQHQGIKPEMSSHQFKLFMMDLYEKTLSVCMKFAFGELKPKESEKPKNEIDELLTTDQVSIILQCTPQYVRQLIRDGRLKGVKYSERKTRISRLDLNEYMKSQDVSKKKKGSK
jgi:excisionase family DNA binding protein